MPDPRPKGESTPWSALTRRTLLLLAIWLLVGPVAGILLVEPLNQLTPGGIPLGFWISQQGSIYVFIVLIFVYAILGDRADRADRASGTHPDAAAGSAATER